MRSQEKRRREAWRLIWWVLGMIAGLLILYHWIEDVTAPQLIAVVGTLTGVFLGSQLNQRQREEEDERKRRALATLLLPEVRLLHIVLNDIYKSQELHMEAIEPFHTAIYDQAGGELLRLNRETVMSLANLYHLIRTLQMELNRFRAIPTDQRLWHNGVLRVRATQAALAIKDTVQLLTDEGGVLPRPFPSFPISGYPPVGPDFPPSPFEG
jgi:hypothetical protein